MNFVQWQKFAHSLSSEGLVERFAPNCFSAYPPNSTKDIGLARSHVNSRPIRYEVKTELCKQNHSMPPF